MKRFRKPHQIPLTLTAQWGKLKHEKPDLVYSWGNGCASADAHLLHNTLTGKRYSVISREWEKSFIEDLAARGYDITTLKFSVSKLNPKEGGGGR